MCTPLPFLASWHSFGRKGTHVVTAAPAMRQVTRSVPGRRVRAPLPVLLALICYFAPAFVPGSISRSLLRQQKLAQLTGSRDVRCRARGGEDDSAIAVGDPVEGLYPDDEQWYPGVVDKVNSDGTYTVKWEDPEGGPESHNLEAASIKKIIIYKDYKVGEAVEGVFPDDGMWYPGEVTKSNEDGSFTVKWEDPDGGPETSDLQPQDMKYPPIPFEKLEVGQKYSGTVRSVLDFGAFVDIGSESDGLLHISRMSRERIDNVYDFVQEGQQVDVWISGKRDDGKYGLTMVEGMTDDGGRRAPADLTPFQDLSPDEFQKGVVARTAPFGAFVTVTLEGGASADGLVHVSQIKDGFVENVDDELSVGDEVQVRVQSVDLDAGRMSLSMRAGFGGGGGGGGFRQPADLSAFEGVSQDEWLTGKVARLAPFGAFVTVTANDVSADGLVHITQIRDGFVESAEASVVVSCRLGAVCWIGRLSAPRLKMSFPKVRRCKCASNLLTRTTAR